MLIKIVNKTVAQAEYRKISNFDLDSYHKCSGAPKIAVSPISRIIKINCAVYEIKLTLISISLTKGGRNLCEASTCAALCLPSAWKISPATSGTLDMDILRGMSRTRVYLCTKWESSVLIVPNSC